ncbi:redoxin domain-containing protein [Hymenobacter monticola]|uniref:Redoxin domain-containing protein n=1 Tax=Hymenobacter monticola TaxID=1705399 RepID=A0ABY4B6A7_9BACT|nr:redoxin domain-containing protein [Hymenobacter monticola]UOE33827.1 redoxin domain-containing protein [Hymenobacter monticola]
MRVLRFATLAALLAGPAVAQTPLKVGDTLPDFVLPRVVNRAGGTFASAEAKGKVLVLEFWSTTCSPCIPALQRLADLQQRHPAEVQVVGISTDSEARLLKFLAKRPVALPLASAPAPGQDVNRWFPHQIISHTVVVDKNRRVVAITSPEQLTDAALLAVAAGRPVHLKPKQDVLNTDPMSYFPVDTATRYAVSVRPFIQGLPGMMRPERQGPLARRRLTAINLDYTSLFQIAYETSYFRIQNQLPDSLRQYDDLSKVCLDFIVPPGQEARLKLLMREALRQYLPVQATWAPATKPAYVLRRLKNAPPLPASTKPEQLSYGGGEFAMQGSALESLRAYLENELQRPVVDETGLSGHYDVAFATEGEDIKGSLVAALAKLGLEVVEAPRQIQMLRLTPVPFAN